MSAGKANLRRDGSSSTWTWGKQASELWPATRALGDLIPCETAYTFDDRELLERMSRLQRRGGRRAPADAVSECVAAALLAPPSAAAAHPPAPQTSSEACAAITAAARRLKRATGAPPPPAVVERPPGAAARDRRAPPTERDSRPTTRRHPLPSQAPETLSERCPRRSPTSATSCRRRADEMRRP